ncbi:hypothetical protein HF673_05475 [Acidithiobacillus thiooxidans]|uniref:hypothetical protein n=1 Tax=Acidithiobacillus thiooxidans TaxID=930 RepID=UPI0004E0B992|nr:hypothetical protein [Acidithiobacillus thiooxidans]MBU2835249.1 hypothetical protein [Acidithiobacillus thiooxidans]
MADIQKIAERIFAHVENGDLPSGYAVAMGALIEIYAHDEQVHAWVLEVLPASVDKLLACMVRHGPLLNDRWIHEYLRQSQRDSAADALSWDAIGL